MRHLIQHTEYREACAQAALPFTEAEQIIQHALQKAIPTNAPTIVHMLGVPGSGKSTYLKTYPHEEYVYLDFDVVLEALPSYQQTKASHGAEEAYRTYELAARAIGYELLFQAIANRLNIIFDHGGSRADHLALLRALKQSGYRIVMIYLPITKEIAAQRAAQRERFLPPEYITQRLATITDLLPGYREVADHFIEPDI